MQLGFLWQWLSAGCGMRCLGKVDKSGAHLNADGSSVDGNLAAHRCTLFFIAGVKGFVQAFELFSEMSFSPCWTVSQWCRPQGRGELRVAEWRRESHPLRVATLSISTEIDIASDVKVGGPKTFMGSTTAGFSVLELASSRARGALRKLGLVE